MAKLSFILCDALESYGNSNDFGSVLKTLKAVGFRGVEVNLAGPERGGVDRLLELTEKVGLPVVSF